MMTKKNQWITAAEHSRLLEADPEFVKQREVRELRHAARVRRIELEQSPLLAELQMSGLNIESVSDLISMSSEYRQAIPILLKHLLQPYSDVTRETIARSLAIPEPEVRKAWKILIEEYKKTPAGWGIKVPGDTEELRLGAKDGLACTLAVAVTDGTLEELIELASDPQNGSSRLLLLSPLKRRRKKNQRVNEVLQKLANDPDLKKEIASWK